ncbi:hypothetical protein FF1_010042 [Malus domestica]
MFYSQFILAKKGPLRMIWISAHLECKLRKNQVVDIDIGVSVGTWESQSRCRCGEQGVPTASPVAKAQEIRDEKKEKTIGRLTIGGKYMTYSPSPSAPHSPHLSGLRSASSSAALVAAKKEK